MNKQIAGEPSEPQRQVVRLSVEYYLTLQHLLATVVGGDLLSATVFLAISRANARSLTAQPAHYTTLDDIPPDDIRVAVSVYAVAKELGLSYETTRRHVAKLVEAGLCVRDEDSRLIVPASVYARPEFKRVVQENWSVTQRYVGAVLDAGMTRAT